VAGPIAAVLVAAGRGERMGGDKLWIDLWGRPVWRWSLDRLLAVPGLSYAAVVVPPGALDRFRQALPSDAEDRCWVVAGGEQRADSALAGIAELTRQGLPDETVVLIHDAARPAASTELMERVAAAVRPGLGAIPTVPVHDALKRLDGSGRMVAAVDREALVGAQTPQGATLGNMRSALEEAQAWGRSATDEAAALAAAGVGVVAVEGEVANRKLTALGDEALLRGALAPMMVPLPAPSVSAGERAGLGFDAHRFDAGRELRLGGLVFSGEPGLAGHSDGDVALHAAIDALLGAAAAGDIGTLYPSADDRWRDVDSAELLAGAVAHVGQLGWRPISLDLTLVAAHPLISARREEMAARIAGLLGLATDGVSVKATTSDGLGFAGAEGIAVFAVAVLASS
jgi:2-C-methyl-D-erythritol 4-phosphate cytidylyltransferase / 2-C-methyl-D-erythritol 2,4-cyclodiphosphate synthase